MKTKQPKGHSNVYADQAEPFHEKGNDRAIVPICGGATVDTVRPLPPLTLSREEWEEIGRRMGWRCTGGRPRLRSATLPLERKSSRERGSP